jgi:hypothetical protein
MEDDMAKDRKEQPEALAAFAVSARSKKKVKTTLTATEQTAPIATDSKKKDRAATKSYRKALPALTMVPRKQSMNYRIESSKVGNKIR